MSKAPVYAEGCDTAPLGFACDETEALCLLRETYTKDLGRLIITAKFTKNRWEPGVVWDKTLNTVTGGCNGRK